MHSCLSPCGDQLMTPNNIVRMAQLKGLDMIAVSDHNTAMHLGAIEKVAREVGIGLLPAMELTTREEVHLLAYFEQVEAAREFSRKIYEHLPPIKNRPEFFGPQVELNEEDEPVREEERLLISALDLGIDQLTEEIRAAGGLAVPAHVNRGNNGILNALGFIPPGAGYAVLEVCPTLPLAHKITTERVLHSSDAHQLGDILERVEYLELSAPTPEAFFNWARGENEEAG